MANDFTARVAGISVELGMSVQNKSGIWCKPTVKMDIKIDGGTNPQQREAIIKQAFDEVCDNIEKTVTNEAIMEYAKKMNENRSEGVLSVDSAGRLNTKGVGASVRKNTFYGE